MAECEFEKRPDGVALITLNRPETLNSIGGALVGEFGAAMDECRADPAVRCIAVTGAGRGFCSGGDVSGMQRTNSGEAPAPVPQTVEESIHGFTDFQMNVGGRVYTCPKPTVALLNGVAAGGGMGFALCFDIRIISDRGRFVSAFKNVGQSGDVGMAMGLERIVGRSRALEILYRSESIDAERAVELGLANFMLPHEELLTKGLDYCAELAAGPTAVYARMKANVTHAETHTFQESLELESFHWKMSQLGDDHKSAVAAFMEGRKPTFVGR